MVPQPQPVKNSRAFTRKQDSQEDSDETAIMSKPMEKENKKPTSMSIFPSVHFFKAVFLSIIPE